MQLTLLIMAAGAGSRFGGAKQLAPVGPSGATLMEYTAFDALQGGFGRFVVVIRPDSEEAMRAQLSRGLGRRAEVVLCHQETGSIPCGVPPVRRRRRPWGTAHAVLAAAPALQGPFGVANADDLYGTEAVMTLGAFLSAPRAPADRPQWAMVGYRLGHTLPPAGTVSRALCRQDGEGNLQGLVEIPAIRREGADGRWRDADGIEHSTSAETLVSMNLWGFTPDLLPRLGRGFRHFLAAHPAETDEFLLPRAVGEALDEGAARVRVLPSAGHWCGITSRADYDEVRAVIADLVTAGAYPEQLWD